MDRDYSIYKCFSDQYTLKINVKEKYLSAFSLFYAQILKTITGLVTTL